MKIVILILIIIIVLFVFRVLQIKLKSSATYKKKDEEKIVDLEKDSKTDEYKPKEYLMLSLQLIIMKLQMYDVIETVKVNYYWDLYDL